MIPFLLSLPLILQDLINYLEQKTVLFFARNYQIFLSGFIMILHFKIAGCGINNKQN